MKPGGRDDAVYLLDANVLIALVVTDHEHHARAAAWMSSGRRFAVCPVTQGALVRFLLRQGETGGRVHAVLQGIAGLEGCQFWADELSYADIELSEVRGHRQVTDSYVCRTDQVTGWRPLGDSGRGTVCPAFGALRPAAPAGLRHARPPWAGCHR